MPNPIPPFDWAQERIDTQELNEAIRQLGRYLKEKTNMPALRAFSLAAEPNGNRFVIGGLEEGWYPHTEMQFQVRSCGSIRPDLEEAIRRAHQTKAVVPLELGTTLAGAELVGQGTRPRPSREEILDLYRACAGTQELDGQPLYERFALLVLERWGCGPAAPAPETEKPQWIVNNLAELGVRIRNRFFFLYKGRSLEYKQEDAEGMHWRPVGEREFGETCHPINYKDPTHIGTVSLDDSDEWRPLPLSDGQ